MTRRTGRKAAAWQKRENLRFYVVVGAINFMLLALSGSIWLIIAAETGSAVQESIGALLIFSAVLFLVGVVIALRRLRRMPGRA